MNAQRIILQCSTYQLYSSSYIVQSTDTHRPDYHTNGYSLGLDNAPMDAFLTEHMDTTHNCICSHRCMIDLSLGLITTLNGYVLDLDNSPMVGLPHSMGMHWVWTMLPWMLFTQVCTDPGQHSHGCFSRSMDTIVFCSHRCKFTQKW